MAGEVQVEAAPGSPGGALVKRGACGVDWKTPMLVGKMLGAAGGNATCGTGCGVICANGWEAQAGG